MAELTTKLSRGQAANLRRSDPHAPAYTVGSEVADVIHNCQFFSLAHDAESLSLFGFYERISARPTLKIIRLEDLQSNSYLFSTQDTHIQCAGPAIFGPSVLLVVGALQTRLLRFVTVEATLRPQNRAHRSLKLKSRIW